MNSPILVVGPGRCGTSSVAQILRGLGVFMGAALVPANRSNPNGHFEDVDFRNLNQWRLDGTIQKEDWEQGIKHLASMRSGNWGFKDPRIAHFVQDYIRIFSPRFIRCLRPLPEIISSMCRWYNWTEQQARQLAEFREAMLNHYLNGNDVLSISINDLKACRAHAKIEEFLNV